jgi:hypothetical protein
MINFVFIAHAAARFFFLTTPLVGSDRQVLLVDAYSFGLTYEGAKICQATCIRHHQAMLSEIPDWQCEAWNQSMWVRRQRWAMLVDALDKALPAIQRLERLNELRESLGTAEFLAGNMVGAVPSYGE